MNKRFLEQLKTKAKTFGFSDEEVDNAVAMLSKLNPNLNNDDLSDEEINSSIEAVIPMFKSAQSHSDRVVRNKDNENKKAVEQLNAKIKELESKKKQQNEEEHGGDEVSDAILKRLEALEQQNKSLSENLLKTQTENLSQQRLSMFVPRCLANTSEKCLVSGYCATNWGVISDNTWLINSCGRPSGFSFKSRRR